MRPFWRSIHVLSFLLSARKSPAPAQGAEKPAQKEKKTFPDSVCAQTGALSATAASIAHAATTGMQYKNLIGPEIMRRRDRLDWTQSDLAVKLQLAGWDIDRSQLSKIECRLVHLSDFQQMFFARVFKVSLNDLFPSVDPDEKLSDFLARTMERKRKPIPRGRRRKVAERKNPPKKNKNP